MFEPVSLNSILHDFDVTNGFTKYMWGSKPKPSNSKPLDSDCSGWTRWTLLRAGMPKEFPDGSIAQGEWLIAQGLHQPTYPDILTFAKHDSGRLFCAGFNSGGTHRHIWFVIAAQTYECAVGTHGVGTRHAEIFAPEVLLDGWCVEIPVNL